MEIAFQFTRRYQLCVRVFDTLREARAAACEQDCRKLVFVINTSIYWFPRGTLV